MRHQQPFAFEHPPFGAAFGWRERREFRRALRRQYRQHCYPFGFFRPIIGMFWILVVVAFTFSTGFRYAMLDVFSSIGHAFSVLFTGSY